MGGEVPRLSAPTHEGGIISVPPFFVSANQEVHLTRAAARGKIRRHDRTGEQ